MFFKRRCATCDERDHSLEFVKAYDMYGAAGYKEWFHTHCLDAVAAYPEAFTNRQVDSALSIIELQKHWKEEEIELRKKYSLKYRVLQTYFES